MSSTADIEAQASEWLARQDGEQWSTPQQLALDEWLDACVAHRVAYLRLAEAWRRAGRLAALSGQTACSIAPAIAPAWRSGWRIAAGLMLALGLAAGVGVLRQGDAVDAYSAARGTRKDIELADGSRLTLNTDTRLRASVDARQRHVWLERGEAFFEVTHDAKRPFVIEAGGQRVTVLGTKFSVRLDGDRVQVQVVEGQVRVQARASQRGHPAAVLGRNEMVLAQAQQLLVSAKTAQQISNALSWRQGLLVLDQMTLAQAASEFNRYNSKQIVVTDPALAQMRIGGSFQIHSVEAFARLLQQGFGLKVHESENVINISS